MTQTNRQPRTPKRRLQTVIEEDESSNAALEVTDVDQEYEIEAVCAMLKDTASGVEYYWTKWVGYPYAENTWEPIHELKLQGELQADAEFQREVYLEKMRISRAIANAEPYDLRDILDAKLRGHLADFYVAEMTRFHEGLTMFLHEAESWRRR